jgi:tetratricopeptide (TPR) repeat protein
MLPALGEFKIAATIDSTFAPAYVGQALVYALGYRTDAEVEAAVSRALALDSTLAEAWAARGFSRAFQQWDWRGAEAALTRAAELDPRNVTTLQWMAALRMVQRRPADAEAYLRRAINVAPGAPGLHADLCEALYYRRDFARAREACERALSLDPQHPFASNHLVWLEMISERGGSRARADLAAPRYDFDEYLRARLHAALGQRDSAVVYAASAVEQRAVIAPFLRPDPLFDPFRDDPRWIAAMRRMGLGP